MVSSTPSRRINFPTIDSTNAEAARQRAAGEYGPVWICAKQQTAGRGRSGRAWSSPEGNLSATFLFPFLGTSGEAPRLGFAAALAVADTVAEHAPGLRLRLKWPNDVLLEDKKISGILLEGLGANPDGTQAVAIGIGINLATHPAPSDTRWPATSVVAETSVVPGRDAALDLLDLRLVHWIERLSSEGFPAILAAWKARAAHLGREITVQTAEGPRNGRFADLDADGALVLETGRGRETFAAGDVSLGEARHAARH